jgi:hypothetical protein
LKGSSENEPNLKWSLQMREVVREMIHFRKTLVPNDSRDPDVIDPAKVAELEAKYDAALDLAKDEYEYDPPSKYYREGFLLYTKMLE